MGAGAAEAADNNKSRLAILSGCLLALVPWMQISRAVKEHVALPLGPLAAVIVAGVAIHLLYLAVNIAAVTALRLGGPGEEGVVPPPLPQSILCPICLSLLVSIFTTAAPTHHLADMPQPSPHM